MQLKVKLAGKCNPQTTMFMKLILPEKDFKRI